MYIIFRNNTQIEVTKEDAELVVRELNKTEGKFFMLKGNLYNKVDITAIVNGYMSDKFNHESRGDWQCHRGMWHKKFKECDCKCGYPIMDTISEFGGQEHELYSSGVRPYGMLKKGRWFALSDSQRYLRDKELGTLNENSFFDREITIKKIDQMPVNYGGKQV